MKRQLITATLLATLTYNAQAAYVGPSSFPSYENVQAILANPQDDALVTLEGRLIKQVGKEKYLFSDGSGEIRVDIDHKYFPNTAINENTVVRLRGEIEKDFMQSPEIDVEFPLEIVK